MLAKDGFASIQIYLAGKHRYGPLSLSHPYLSVWAAI